MDNATVIQDLIDASSGCELDSAIATAGDFVSVDALSTLELQRVFKIALEKYDLARDREAALHLLSFCSVSLGSLAGQNLDDLILKSDGFVAGEMLHLVNILSNTDNAKYIPFLEKLARLEDDEVSPAAKAAIAELSARKGDTQL